MIKLCDIISTELKAGSPCCVLLCGCICWHRSGRLNGFEQLRVIRPCASHKRGSLISEAGNMQVVQGGLELL